MTPKKIMNGTVQTPGISQYKQIPDPYARPFKQLPLIAAKDIFWALYLYPGRFLARAPKILNFCLKISQPAIQLFMKPLRNELAHHLLTAFGPEKTYSACDSIARKCIENDVRRVGDDLLLEHNQTPIRCFAFNGRKHLDDALAAGNGVLLLGLHWMAERVALQHLMNSGYPVMSIRNQEPPDDCMGRLGRKFLQPRYVRFLHNVIRDEVFIQDRECSLKILGRLRSNGIVSLLIDAPFSQEVMKLPFLGKTRYISTGALHLARISSCSVLPMIATGNADGLEIQIHPPLVFDYSIPKEEFCRRYMPLIIQILELSVLRYPDQYDCWSKINNNPCP